MEAGQQITVVTMRNSSSQDANALVMARSWETPKGYRMDYRLSLSFHGGKPELHKVRKQSCKSTDSAQLYPGQQRQVLRLPICCSSWLHGQIFKPAQELGNATSVHDPPDILAPPPQTPQSGRCCKWGEHGYRPDHHLLASSVVLSSSQD